MSAETLWQAAVLGVVQGVTEFLPVSSTGHLILVPAIFGWHGGIVDSLQFDVALHVGTLAALLGVFWSDWMRLLHAGLRSIAHRSLSEANAKLAWLIVLATLPAGAAGLLFQRHVETSLRSPLIVGITMVAVGIVLAAADHWGRRTREELTLGWLAALGIGIAQAAALIPGVSRSGSTIAAGMAVGLTRPAAARFSFLLSTPILLAAIGKGAVDVLRQGITLGEAGVFAVGMVTAAVSGYLCIRLLLGFLRTRSLWPFVVYRVVAGSGVLALVATGRV